MNDNIHYLNSRVRAMKGKLLDKKDYRKILKMEPNEVSEFLGKLSYSESINNLGLKYNGEELVELAIEKDLVKTAKKLVKLSDGEVKRFLENYFLKYDTRNLRKVFSWKNRSSSNGMSKEMVVKHLEESPNISKHDISFLVDENTKFEDLENFVRNRFSRIINGEEVNSFNELELLMDKKYLLNLVNQVKQLGISDYGLKKFLRFEVDTANINTVGRARLMDKNSFDLDSYLVKDGDNRIGNLSVSDLKSLYETDEATFMEKVSDYTDTDGENLGFMESIEIGIERKRFNSSKSLSLSPPKTVSPVLGYVVRKETEVENIRKIVRGKKLGLDDSEISKRVVF